MHFMLTGRDPAARTTFHVSTGQQLCPDTVPNLRISLMRRSHYKSRNACRSAADFKRRLTRIKNPTATSIAPPAQPARGSFQRAYRGRARCAVVRPLR